MFRNYLNLAVQQKFVLMLVTCLVYITGLFAYFNDSVILFAGILLILGVIGILRNYLSPKLVLFWYFTFVFAFFNANFRMKNSDALYQIAPQKVTVQGQIVSIPTTVNGKTKFFFQSSKVGFNGKSEKISAKTLVSVYSENKNDSKFNIGDSFVINGKLRTPFEVTNPSQFDYGKYLKNYDTFTLLYADEGDCRINKTSMSYKWRFMQSLNNVRIGIIKAHSQCLKSPNIELLGGMVFGDDAIAPTQELKDSFQHSGLLHLLAASGMNVALIYGIWFFILRKLKVPFNITVGSGIFIVIFYALMTGLGASVVRATFMLVFILVGKLIDRDADSLSLLSFVALLMLVYNPAYINDVGFQLSFLVTFGLLVMAPVVFEKIKFIPDWLSGAIFVPIIAQIWVAPIQMFYFNSFSLYSVFANIVILPFVTVVSFGGFISAVLALIKPLAGQVCFLFDIILNPILNVVVWISDYFANLPHSLIQMPQPSVSQLFLYYAIVLLSTLLIKIGRNKKLILAIIISIICLIVSCIKLPSNNLETIAFDVQNADAFLIKTPQNKYFIIDSGKMPYNGGKSQAQMIILSYLKDYGIKNIEGLIITHFDSDHAGGAVDLINTLNIKHIYVNSLSDKSHLAQKIYASARHKNNNSLHLVKNNEIFYKESALTIKNFVCNFKGKDVDNENSIITLVSDGDFDELFMGDAGIKSFDKIKNYIPAQVEVLKVGHHGAKNVVNRSFVSRIKPKVAIVSTGLNNYGHPNGVTLDILQHNKVKVLRTDRQNSIKITEKSDIYKIYSFNKNEYVEMK